MLRCFLIIIWDIVDAIAKLLLLHFLLPHSFLLADFTPYSFPTSSQSLPNVVQWEVSFIFRWLLCDWALMSVFSNRTKPGWTKPGCSSGSGSGLHSRNLVLAALPSLYSDIFCDSCCVVCVCTCVCCDSLCWSRLSLPVAHMDARWACRKLCGWSLLLNVLRCWETEAFRHQPGW